MAAARKCDRCGTCFDPTSENGEMARFINPVFQTRESIKECRIVHRLLEDQSGETMVDLCPRCTARFKAFMDGLLYLGLEDAREEKE